ncbi:MAG: hypothetical protein WDO73_31470 [Ignavibacteriota bacterium]
MERQNFTGGQTQQYTYTWNVPSGQANGNYTVMIGVFDAGWSTNYYWNSNGATVTVTATPPHPPRQPDSGPARVTRRWRSRGRRVAAQRRIRSFARVGWRRGWLARCHRSYRHYLHRHGTHQRDDLLLQGGGSEYRRDQRYVQ